MSDQEKAGLVTFKPYDGDDQPTLLLRLCRCIPKDYRVTVMVPVVVTVGLAAALLLGLVTTLPLRSAVVRKTEFCTRNYTKGDTCLVKIDINFCRNISLTIDIEQHPNASALLDIFPSKPKLSFTAPVSVAYSDVIKRDDYHLLLTAYLHPGSLLSADVCAMWASSACVPSMDKPEQHFAFFIFQGKEKYERFRVIKNFDDAVLHREFDITLNCKNYFIAYNYTEDDEYYHVITKVAPSNCKVFATANVILQRKQYDFTGTERDIACRVDRLNGTSCSRPVDGRHYVFATAYDISGSSIVNLDEKVYLSMSCSLHYGYFAAIAVPIIIVVIVIVGIIVVYSVCDQRNRNKANKATVHLIRTN